MHVQQIQLWKWWKCHLPCVKSSNYLPVVIYSMPWLVPIGSTFKCCPANVGPNPVLSMELITSSSQFYQCPGLRHTFLQGPIFMAWIHISKLQLPYVHWPFWGAGTTSTTTTKRADAENESAGDPCLVSWWGRRSRPVSPRVAVDPLRELELPPDFYSMWWWTLINQYHGI